MGALSAVTARGECRWPLSRLSRDTVCHDWAPLGPVGGEAAHPFVKAVSAREYGDRHRRYFLVHDEVQHIRCESTAPP